MCNNTLTYAINKTSDRGVFRILHLQMFDDEIKRAAEEALGLLGKEFLPAYVQGIITEKSINFYQVSDIQIQIYNIISQSFFNLNYL